jgi:hypothetical protein
MLKQALKIVEGKYLVETEEEEKYEEQKKVYGKTFVLEGFKVDDIVIPNVGPHKGIKHNVVDVFEDGSLTIEPVGLLKKNVRYVNGIVVAAPEQVRKIDE